MSPKAPEELSQKRRQARSKALAQAVVAAFADRLQEEAGKHGGYLSQRHIEDLNAEFQTKADQLSIVFEQAFVDAAREQEELRWHAMKRPAFDRLMVKRFEHLFIHRETDGVMHGNLARRMLPGFFLSLSMMLGPEALSRYQVRCDAAVDRVMPGKLPVDWDLVDNDPDVHDIVLDAQYAIVLHFEDAVRRADWFINITNSHLAPVPEGAGDTQWELNHRVFHVLINSLLSDLKEAVADDAAWRHLAERQKGSDRHKVALILDRLE